MPTERAYTVIFALKHNHIRKIWPRILSHKPSLLQTLVVKKCQAQGMGEGEGKKGP